MTSSWLEKLSRRAALGAAGAAAASVVTAPLARAQQATPEPDTRRVVTMFVQTAQAGSFLPKPGEPGVFELTLDGATAQTIFFSDRPDRIVGDVPTEQFLEALGFTPADPPNAAIVAQTAAGEDILVVELFNPQWDGSTQSLTYDVRILQDYQGDGLGQLGARQEDAELAETFGHTSLFIDDCASVRQCWKVRETVMGRITAAVGNVPGGPFGQCWDWGSLSCSPCDGTPREVYDDLCNETYPACNGTCIT